MREDLSYDHIGFAQVAGGYVGRRNDGFSAWFGRHPHDPDECGRYLGCELTEDAAVRRVKEAYRQWLEAELEKLRD
jgi:hypothetical protein